MDKNPRLETISEKLMKKITRLEKDYECLLLAYYNRVQSILTVMQNDVLELMMRENKPMNATEVAKALNHNNRVSTNNMMYILVRKKVLDVSAYRKNRFTYFVISDVGLLEYINLAQNENK